MSRQANEWLAEKLAHYLKPDYVKILSHCICENTPNRQPDFIFRSLSILKQMQTTRYTSHSLDSDLVAGCRSQDRLAQQCLYQRHFGKLLGICMRYTGSRTEAEDVLNRAFLKIFQGIGEYSEQGNLQSWLATVTLRTAIDYVRQHVKYRRFFDFGEPPEQPLDPDALDHLQTEDIYRFIQKLPAANRAVFSLNVVEGFTLVEISEMLGVNLNTAKWRLAEAKKQLRQWLVVASAPIVPCPAVV